MAGKPIAIVGSLTVCPLTSGTVPHVGGPIAGPGMPNVTINGQPVAVMGDVCTCVGPPATIIQGEPSVLINGTPVVTVGSMTSHGGQVTSGVPTVTISSATPSAKNSAPLKEIPFPKVTPLDTIGAVLSGTSKSQAEAKENILQNEQASCERTYIPFIGFSI